MERVVTAAAMRRLEQAAVDAGDSYAALMERAGTAAADVFTQRMAFSEHDIVLVVCGGGNNGGDGFVIAERLCETTNAAVCVLLTCESSSTDLARERFVRLRHTRTQVKMLSDHPTTAELTALLQHVTCVIDAVYGIGFYGKLPDMIGKLFDAIREKELPVLAVDIPSGLSADDGTWDRRTMSARITVTFTAKKPAMLSTAQTLCGEIVVADVGIPTSLTERYETPLCFLKDAHVRDCFVPRPAESHKGTFGSVLEICGSYGMAGAALLCGKAALRCGVGLLHVALPESIYPIVASSLWEAVCHPMMEVRGVIAASQHETLSALAVSSKALVIGCGLSQSEEAATLLKKVLPAVTVPIVLDADGLNLASAHTDMLKAMKAPLIVTPHPLEMARLMNCTVDAIQKDRIGSARAFAMEHRAVVALKGHRTVVASPSGEVFINTSGTCGMATGGSGDVLSGMIASFAAQGMSPLDAALCGVYLHGRVGEMTARSLGVTAMLPTDMLDTLPSLLSQYEKQE